MRYHAKGAKLCRETKPRKILTTTTALRNEIPNPIAKTGRSAIERWSKFLISLYPEAAQITGRERKNENWVAATRLVPTAGAHMIVAPDRDTPGRSASHWASTTPSAGLRV